MNSATPSIQSSIIVWRARKKNGLLEKSLDGDLCRNAYVMQRYPTYSSMTLSNTSANYKI